MSYVGSRDAEIRALIAQLEAAPPKRPAPSPAGTTAVRTAA